MLSIYLLDLFNDEQCLIVERSNWKNDFSFVVERFEGSKTIGTQILEGIQYIKALFNKFAEEFRMYKGNSRRITEDQ